MIISETLPLDLQLGVIALMGSIGGGGGAAMPLYVCVPEERMMRERTVANGSLVGALSDYVSPGWIANAMMNSGDDQG